MKDALQRLDDAGHIAYVVGGSVRDFLLGRDVKDHDIATSAPPEELVRLFPNAITVGKAFGVLKVPFAPGQLIEIATFRQDLEYQDHRHPTGILFAGPAEDARRRDFTVNGLFFDPKTSRILDSVGGLEDLRSRTIRAIGNPSERFREDALRLLRAVRFASRLSFEIEAETAEAIRARARLVTRMSAERVRDELTLTWTGPRPADALQRLSRFGLLQCVLPEVAGFAPPMADRRWEHTLKVLEMLARRGENASLTVAWAAVLVEVAKAARKVCERLRLSRAECEEVDRLLEEHPKVREAFQMREATLERFVRQPGFDAVLALHRADAAATDGDLAAYEFCESRLVSARDSGAAPRLLTGEDLIQLGFRPGPRFSRILREVEDLALERKLKTKEEALEHVIRKFEP